ncbi:MAG: aspartate/glutamate racemase family protein [Pseudomonadota bacterium]
MALQRRLPGQRFLYLGDHASAPYGERHPREIYDLTQAGVESLFVRGCRLVVLACNTASALSLRALQQQWLPGRAPECRILGVFAPAVEAITHRPWQLDGRPAEECPTARKVAVFATRRTVESGAFPREIAARSLAVSVFQQACPGLAGRIEAGASRRELYDMIRDDVSRLLHNMDGQVPDLAVLACTHYPLVSEAFEAALPAATQLLSQPDLVGKSLQAYLQRHPEFRESCGPGVTSCLTTGDPLAVSERASSFTGQDWTFEALTNQDRAKATA